MKKNVSKHPQGAILPENPERDTAPTDKANFRALGGFPGPTSRGLPLLSRAAVHSSEPTMSEPEGPKNVSR